MKITDIKTYVVKVSDQSSPWPWLFVEVETDEGITGLGEATDTHAAPALITAFETIKPMIVGEDPANIEEIWQRIFHSFSNINGRGFTSHLISAIDTALWDIRGKVLGQPIYNLIGGPVRDRVPLYTHIQDIRQANGLQDAYDQTKRVISEGYTAIKTDPFNLQRPSGPRHWGADKIERLAPEAIREAVDWMDTVRDAAGPEAELMVDAHARFDTASAIAAGQALEHVNLIWYEEPVPPQNYAALQQVRENTSIPLCMGERHFTRYDYLPLFEHRLVDYVMPDILWTGGISEMKRIGSMAEAYYVRIAPHDAMGPVSIISGFHCSMTMPNLYRLECLHTWFDDFAKILDPMFRYEGDSILPTDEPGLGIALNHEVLDRYIVQPEAFINFG
ncbi:MAG: mandelate racemase/muconate lactonizing enzyme family protein, partial [Dehalococcoidia bacterium]|jgi:galactonate dehydratase|nr:mandelate racemase/muconate lactonizing enzyme family protein [Dehalococcoidia bacterium]